MGLSFATFQSAVAVLVFITQVLVTYPMEQEILCSFRTWAASDSASQWLHYLGTLDHFHNLFLYIFFSCIQYHKKQGKIFSCVWDVIC